MQLVKIYSNSDTTTEKFLNPVAKREVQRVRVRISYRSVEEDRRVAAVFQPSSRRPLPHPPHARRSTLAAARRRTSADARPPPHARHRTLGAARTPAAHTPAARLLLHARRRTPAAVRLSPVSFGIGRERGERGTGPSNAIKILGGGHLHISVSVASSPRVHCQRVDGQTATQAGQH